MKKIKFTDHKKSILEAINNKNGSHGIQEPTSLVEGFFKQPIYNEVSGNIIIVGPTIPMIAVAGTSSGRIYFFALKALLPNLEM